MRPHRLRVQAFGAFAATEEVSFDDLEGLFLLHGETGAGKTTLLDAIAFALYGRVPGERGKTPQAQVRPRAGRRPHRGGARGHDRRPATADHPQAGTGAPEEVGHGRDQGAGVGAARRADPGRGLGGQVRPHRRGRRRDRGPDGHVRRAVLPGGAPPAGPVRAVPARRRRGQGAAAAEAVRHRQVPRRRRLAGRAPPRHRRRGDGRRRPGEPPGGSGRPGRERRGPRDDGRARRRA